MHTDPPLRANSSASVALEWDAIASACRPQLRWRLEVRRGGASWVPLATSLRLPHYHASTLRCPEGCSFRVAPANLAGWALAEMAAAAAADEDGAYATSPSSPDATAFAATPFAATPLLPPLPPATMRLELALSGRPAGADGWSADAAEATGGASADLARAVGVPLSHVAVVEARGEADGAVYIIADLRAHGGGEPNGEGGAGGRYSREAAGATADAIADRLVDALLDEGSTLYRGSVTSAVDPRAGVQRLDADGALTQLLTPSQLRAASRLPAAVRAAAAAAAANVREREAANALEAARVHQAALMAAEAEAAWRLEHSDLTVALEAVGALITRTQLGALAVTLAVTLAVLSALAGALAAMQRQQRVLRESFKRVDFVRDGLTVASGHVEVGEASDTLGLLDMVAGLAHELLKEPMADEATLLCVDSLGRTKPLLAEVMLARRAVSLRVVLDRR